LIPFSLLVSLGTQFHWRTIPAVVDTQPQWSYFIEDFSKVFVVTSPASRVATHPASIPILLTLFCVWLGGCLISIVLWFRWWGQIWAARKEATPLSLGLPIPVMSSAERLEPGIVGILKPVLLLPEDIAEWLTPEQLHAVLAHEMCHIRRRDNLTAAIHMLVEAVFWFYPLVWWIRTRLVEERERACDEAVLQSGSDAENYAEGILNVCKLYVESPLACVSGISGSDLKKRIVRIMTQPLADNLSLGRKMLLVAVGMAAMVLPIGFGLLNATVTRAQSQAPSTAAPAHVYEVASIKPNKSGNPMVAIRATPDGLTIQKFTLHRLILFAYGIQDDQISGGPSWLNSEAYDIEAKMDKSVVDEMQKLSEVQRKLERQLMLQALLADRFQLSLRRETKELPVYALVIGKNGPKIQPSKPGDAYPNGLKGDGDRPLGAGALLLPEKGKLVGQGVPIESLAKTLSRDLRGRIADRMVVDKTGLTGNFDFTLQWTPEESEGPPSPDSSGPSIFTAIQEQLGLKLESQKAPVEILVIDHVEKPSEN
jgi:bla regulator protein blaR1